MRTFGRVETAIWQSRKFRSCSERARLLYLYVVACPHGNAVGCFLLPRGYMEADMGWASETLSPTLSELLSKGLVERCPHSELTRIVGWWGHNKIENPNVATAAIKSINALPFNSQVFHNFVSDLKQYHERYPKLFTEGVWKVFENGLPNRLPDPLPNPIETKEPEPEKEPEPSEANASGAVAPDVSRETKQPELIPRPEAPKPAADDLHDVPLFLIRGADADFAAALWKHAVPWLVRKLGKPDASCRNLLGKWRSIAKNDGALWAVLSDASAQPNLLHLESWVAARLKSGVPASAPAPADEALSPTVRDIIARQKAERGAA